MIEWSELRSPTPALPAVAAGPTSADVPTVVVLTDVFGDNPFHRSVGRRLVERGFRVVIPDLFARVGPLTEPTKEAAFARRRELDEREVLDDLATLVGGLQSVGRVGTMGFCMGGTLALDLSADLDAPVTVAFYGFPQPANPDGRRTPAPLDRADQLRGPILGLWGDQDETVGMAHVEALDRRLSEAGIPHDFRIYPGLAHGFLARAFDHAADPNARAGWDAAVEFLETNLRCDT